MQLGETQLPASRDCFKIVKMKVAMIFAAVCISVIMFTAEGNPEKDIETRHHHHHHGHHDHHHHGHHDHHHHDHHDHHHHDHHDHHHHDHHDHHGHHHHGHHHHR